LKNLGNQYIEFERFIKVNNILNKFNIYLNDKEILEIGCADGKIIHDLINLGADDNLINAIDIRGNRIQDAKVKLPNVKFLKMDASEMDFDDSKFDIITTFTLFSSILNEESRAKVATEIHRILKPNGFIIYYDLRINNPINKNVIGIKKNDLYKLFPNMKYEIQSTTVLPPISRKLGKFTNSLYPFLTKLSCLHSHYIGILFK